MNLNDFPDLILIEIFACLPAVDRLSAEMVCHRWNTLVKCHAWKHKKCSSIEFYCSDVNKEYANVQIITCLRRAGHFLKRLKISFSKYPLKSPDEWIRVLTECCPNVKILDLEIELRSSLELLSVIGPNLEAITLRSCFTGRFSRVFRTLRINYCFDSSTKILLERCERLKKLKLKDNTVLFAHQCLQVLPTTLTSLDLRGTTLEMQSLIRFLQRPSNLKKFCFCCDDFSTRPEFDEFLHLIVLQKELTEFKVTLNDFRNIADINKLLSYSQNLTRLTIITPQNDIDNKMLIDFCSCGRLRYLKLKSKDSYCPVNNATLLSLSSECSQLRFFQIEHNCCQLENAKAMATLNQLQHLHYLDISNTLSVNDSVVQNFATITTLEVLKVDGCIAVTDAGISPVIRGCKKLSRLSFKGCRMITDELIKELQNCINQRQEPKKVFIFLWTFGSSITVPEVTYPFIRLLSGSTDSLNMKLFRKQCTD
ncbi:unnamed protein product [Enterobius vermicularis]|uniref:F-box domain-containing protein n=1 Tax=Enterobius vermicularis TaxID=51028 RepID=A0A0N4VGN9_ENTVE|nr:unnamed protein product [Enterobius vermicularis]